MYLGMTTLSRYQSATGYRHGLGYSIQQNIASIVLDERLVEYRMWNRRDQVFPSCERVDCIVRALPLSLGEGRRLSCNLHDYGPRPRMELANAVEAGCWLAVRRKTFESADKVQSPEFSASYGIICCRES